MKNLPRHQSNEKHKNKLNKVMLVATLGKFLYFSKVSRALYLMKFDVLVANVTNCFFAQSVDSILREKKN